jgi:sulfite reductase beta subunit-like hemoprotein
MSVDEIIAVEEAVRREAQAGPTDETKHLRVRRGTYSMRGQPGRYVARIRIPAGILTVDQLEVVADLVESYAGLGVAHFTTRQGIEIADVPGGDIGEILRHLDVAGLTTRRTGGNVVRNVVCCPLAGVSPAEFFDVTPYALATDRYFRDAAAYQQLPRKAKIAFEGCPEDHVRTAVADIGLRAWRQNGHLGFRISVGGGLGAVPMVGQPLEDFTPVEALFPTLEAMLRVYDRHGNRQKRARARLKWLLKDWGIERLRDAVFCERARIGSTGTWLASGATTAAEHPLNESPPRVRTGTAKSWELEAFQEWRTANVRSQRQQGVVAVFVRCPLGDLRLLQLRRLAAAARNFSGGIRTTIEQNVLLRWVPQAALPELYEFLEPEGLATCCTDQIMDTTCCVGAETCLSARTNPKTATRAIAGVLSEGLYREPALRSLRIRISGCLNSCGHHHAADIGLFGKAKRFHGRPVPQYVILLGGVPSGRIFGQRVIEIPACRVVQAVERVLKLYLGARHGEEPFAHFVERIGVPALRAHLEDLTRVPPPEQDPEFYRDLDATRDFTVEAREGECAA